MSKRRLTAVESKQVRVCVCVCVYEYVGGNQLSAMVDVSLQVLHKKGTQEHRKTWNQLCPGGW